MPLNAIPPTTTLANLREKTRAAEGQCLVDVAFWGGVIPGNQVSISFSRSLFAPVFFFFFDSVTISDEGNHIKLPRPLLQEHLVPLVNAGVKGFKCFLIESGVDEFPCVSAAELDKSMAILEVCPFLLYFVKWREMYECKEERKLI
jgi:allantoinase